MENKNHDDICNLRERLARLEADFRGAEKALELARSSVSRASIISTITIIISIVSVAVSWIKH